MNVNPLQGNCVDSREESLVGTVRRMRGRSQLEEHLGFSKEMMQQEKSGVRFR